MNSKSSGGKLERFFTGKGFYIVLFLCAAVIGVSAWMMAAGDRSLARDIRDMNQTSLDKHRVETVIIPPQEQVPEMQEAAAPAAEEELAETMAAPEDTQVWREEPAPAPEEALPAEPEDVPAAESAPTEPEFPPEDPAAPSRRRWPWLALAAAGVVILVLIVLLCLR